MTFGQEPHADACDTCAIISLYAEYNRSIDAGHSQRWALTFTSNGVFEHPSSNFVGHDELERFIVERQVKLNASPLTQQRHWNHAIDIQITGESASASCNLLVSGVRPGIDRTEVVTTGIYADDLLKGKHGWRFLRRRLTIDVPR